MWTDAVTTKCLGYVSRANLSDSEVHKADYYYYHY